MACEHAGALWPSPRSHCRWHPALGSCGITGEYRPLLLGHNRQSRHPHHRERDDVVGLTEVGLVAGDHPVGTRVEVGRVKAGINREILVPLLEVGRGRQVGRMLTNRGEGQDRGPVLVIEPARVGLAGPKPALPVGLADAEVDLGEIAVADANCRKGRSPGSFARNHELL